MACTSGEASKCKEGPPILGHCLAGTDNSVGRLIAVSEPCSLCLLLYFLSPLPSRCLFANGASAVCFSLLFPSACGVHFISHSVSLFLVVTTGVTQSSQSTDTCSVIIQFRLASRALCCRREKLYCVRGTCSRGNFVYINYDIEIEFL